MDSWEKDESGYPVGKCNSLSNIYYDKIVKLFPFKQIDYWRTERAYKKDSGKLCAFGIETLFLAIATMGLLYVNIEIQNIFLPIAASISMLFAIYYVAKSIYLYSKMKKKYFVDNMKDIIQKEEKE